VGSALLYLLFFGVIPYLEAVPSEIDQLWGWPHYLALPETFYRLTGQNPGFASSYFFNALLFVGLLAGLFWLYYRAYRLCERIKVPARWLFGISLGLGLLFMIQPFLLSSDVFFYSLAGRILGIYGQNPLKETPLKFSNDLMFPYVYWRWRLGPTSYGPVWTLLTGDLAIISPANPGWQVLTYKLLALVAYVLTGGFVWKIAGNLRPEAQTSATLLYLWNPLILLEIGSAHNDFIVTVFFMLGLWLFLVAPKSASMIGLALSLLTKVSLAPLVPSFIITWAWEQSGWLRRLLTVIWGGLILVVVAGLFYLPFVLGFKSEPPRPAVVCQVATDPGCDQSNSQNVTVTTATAARSPVDALLDALSSNFTYVNNPAEIAFKGLGAVFRPFTQNDTEALSLANLLVRNGLRLLFVALLLREWWVTRRQAELPDSLLRILFYTLFFINTWFYPWYLVPLVALAVISQSSKWRNAALIFSFSALLYYCLWPIRYYNSPFTVLYLGRSLLLFGPPVAYLLWEWWRSRSASIPEKPENWLTATRARFSKIVR
jgi:hypothetical protein